MDLFTHGVICGDEVDVRAPIIGLRKCSNPYHQHPSPSINIYILVLDLDPFITPIRLCVDLLII